MRTICVLLFLTLIVTCSVAQNKVYFNSGNPAYVLASITEITESKVTYIPLRESKSKTVSSDKILLLFNERGVFLEPAKLDHSQKKTKDLIRNFLHGTQPLTTDYIFKTDNTVITGEISDVNKEDVLLNNGVKIDKKEISAIIYRNGRHELVGSSNRAADVLWTAYNNDFKSPPSPVLKSPEPEVIIPEKQAAEIKPERIIVKEVPSPDNTKPKTDPEVKKAPATVVTATPGYASGNTDTIASETEIERMVFERRKEEFKKKAGEKANQFSVYLKRIVNKEIPTEEVDKAIDLCVQLFVNEDAVVEVSSVNGSSRKVKIRQYLKQLKMLNYDRVELVWTNVQYITNIKKRMDGNYSGIVTFEQEFKGYKDGEIKYQDATVKKAVVILKGYEKIVGGNTQELWDVYLSDIGVETTRKL